MDWTSILHRFSAEVDIVLVAGIIIVVMLVRIALSARKIELSDVVWRLIVAGAGILCGILKGNYEDGPWSIVKELLGSAVKYGGAATLIYQLGKPAIKALLGGEKPPDIKPEDPTVGVPQ